MSQTLTKPILLDETGQAIAGKLDTNSAAIVSKLNDIKEAIGTSADFIPVKIQVVTPPTKTIYKVGERLNLSGMVVNLVGTNGVQIDVTSACTFSPANNTVLTASDTAVTISYLYQHDGTTFTTSQAITIRELSSIAVTTPPIKTAYQTGETLDLTGIVVTATYSDGYTANVTSDCIFSPANGTVLTSSDTSVGINYTEGSVTKSTTIAIGVKELVSIAVTAIPAKTSYYSGESLDLTGIVVTANYDDGSMLNITNACTYNPSDGTTLTSSDTSITITYVEGTVTKTTSQSITVKELISISVTTPPDQTDYLAGDTLDLTGIVVTATYQDSTTANVTSDCTFSPVDGSTLTTSDTSISISCTKGTVTKTTSQALTVTYPCYGIEWDGTSTTGWTRTDLAAEFTNPNPYYAGMAGTPSSPFDNILPWSGMRIVEFSGKGKFVEIPKFWYKISQDSTTHNLKIQIANREINGFHVSPAHMDRGDGHGERDVVYVSRYHYGIGGSESGQAPSTSQSRSSFRSAIHNSGADIWQWDFATKFTIQLLYLVEFADWDSQAKIGRGVGTGSLETMGYTDSMPYHTGTTTSNRTWTACSTQYRYIEGLWENVFDWIDGCYYDANGLNIILNPADFSDSSNGIVVGQLYGGTNQYTKYPSQFTLKEINGLFPLFIPTEANGSNSTYSCDVWNYSQSSNPCLYGGGDYSYEYGQDLPKGLFSVYYSSANWTGMIGSRLMKLPNS